jgi:crotonobetainyl-CoA:carnitine CoA-transferase CaiB-like acyl-CoA transferase
MIPTGPLSGIRIVDLTTIYSGPICVSILGDQGADVIKVEPPGGDVMRFGTPRRNGVSASFSMMNRSKRSVVIDLRQDAGRRLVLDLVRGADVLVENYRPGVLARLGLAYESLAAINPRIVVASINGVGPDGPYAKRRVYDAVIQAVSGIADLQSVDTGKPTMINTLVADKVTAMTAAQTITAALFARERTGVGQRVEISMIDASLFFLWPDSMNRHGIVGDGVEQAPYYSHRAFVRRTRDGYVAVMPVKREEFAGCLRALEIEHLLGDPRFATFEALSTNYAELDRLMDDAYATFTTDEICARLEAEDVPWARLNSRDQVIDDPQIRAMGALVEYEHPRAGRVRQPRPPGRFHSTPAALQRPSPALGEHTDEVLREIGLDAAAIADLRARGVVA